MARSTTLKHRQHRVGPWPAGCVGICSSAADHRTLHITGHIGGSSVLHHGMSQDIHHGRLCPKAWLLHNLWVHRPRPGSPSHQGQALSESTRRPWEARGLGIFSLVRVTWPFWPGGTSLPGQTGLTRLSVGPCWGRRWGLSGILGILRERYPLFINKADAPLHQRTA